MATAIIAGTSTITGTLEEMTTNNGSLNTVINNQVLVQGTSAHDSAATANPVRIGAKGWATGGYNGVHNGDTTDIIATLAGAILQKPYSIPENDWTYACPSPKIDTADTTVKSSVASLRNYLVDFQYINTNAVATELVIKDGATVIWRGYAPANMANSTLVQFDVPLRSSVNSPLNIACITTAASVYINCQGYVAP